MRLSTIEMRQVIGCLSDQPTSYQGPSSPLLPSPTTRASSLATLTTLDSSSCDAAGIPTSLLTSALKRSLPPDTVVAEHWLVIDPIQIARHLTLKDEVMYRGVGHTHLLCTCGAQSKVVVVRRTLAAKHRYSNGLSSSTNWPTSSRVPSSVRPSYRHAHS